jgi:LCP family protein required for cell wall assembly
VPRAVVLKQRNRRRRFIIGMTFFLSVTVTLMGSGYVYLQYRIGQIPRVDLPSLVGDDPDGIMNVLLVGSDSRAGLEGDLALQAGTPSGQRSDTIMVLHIDQKQEQAAILSIPRDLYVPIAGEDYSDRVNAAFALGGPEGLSATLQAALGITINHYVEVDFIGFKDIVDAVGGVQLYLPAWARDFTSGLDLPEIGCVDVNGAQGLAWVRSREFEYLVDGVWIPDPRGDLGRIERQQDFIRRMLKKALSSGITNPLQLNRLIGIGVRDVTLDDTLSTKDITTLARRFNNLDPDSVALLTLPTSPADIDGKSVLELREEEAKPYLDRINGRPGTAATGTPLETTTTLPAESLLYPADVDLQVLNGEGTPGAAAQAAAALETAGFTVAGTGDATEIGRTTIRYGPEAEDAAQLLDQALVGGADLIVDETVTDTDLVLVLGADYQGVGPGPVAPVPRLSTTSTTPSAGVTTSTTALDGAVTTVADDSDPTTSTIVTTTLPPTTMGPPTLPPGVEC